MAASRIRGRLHDLAGRPDEAEREFRDTIELCSANGLAVEEAWSRFDLGAMLLRRKRRPTEAANHLAAAHRIADGVGMVNLVRHLDALEDTIDTDPAARTGLTPREQEVLILIANGHSDRDMARMFGIIPKTVSNHVSSILRKTGCANRAEAAAWATRHGIA